MSIKYMPLGQGLPAGAEGAKEWLDKPWGSWHPFEERDRYLFLSVPDAAFLFRPGLGRYESRRLYGAELVFRSGEREFVDVSGGCRPTAIIEFADVCLKACPSLAADAIPNTNDGRRLGDWLRLSDIDVYVDGCGAFRIGDELVALRNYGDVDPWWQHKIIKDYREYRAEVAGRLWEVNLLVDDAGRPL